MIIDIKQTSANFKNEFEVLLNGVSTYKANTPWMSISAPLDLENLRKLNLLDISDKPIYTSKYELVKNIVQGIFPEKWLIGIEQKDMIYEILDLNNQPQAYFYKSTTGFMKVNHIFIYNNTIYKCYDKSIGKTKRIAIYENDVQIAECIKPLQVTDNLDYYRIYLLPKYENLSSIIAFFTIYFDYLYHRNSGEIMVHKQEIQTTYTYNAYNKYYNENWIPNNFDNNDYKSWLESIGEQREQMKKEISQNAKKILIYIGISWAIILIITGILLFLL